MERQSGSHSGCRSGWLKRSLAVVLAAALVVAIAAPMGVAAILTDDDIPGVPLPESPVADTLHVIDDQNDVYSVDLNAGDTFIVWLDGTGGTDFNLNLYSPGSVTIFGTYPVAYTLDTSYPEAVEYTVPAGQGGTYYVGVWAYTGVGDYTLTWSINTEGNNNIPGETLPASPVSGALDATTDRFDVYSLSLSEHDILSASLTGADGTDFDMYLYPPGSTDISNSSVAHVAGTSYPEAFSYTVPTGHGGTYYLLISAYSGAGDYTVTWSVEHAPILTSVGNKSVDELSQLAFTATATDVDLPAQTLTFSLGAGAPTGAAITSAGDFTWTPTEAQGPGTYDITVAVTDGAASDSETIEVTVGEVVSAPVLDPIGEKSVDELSELAFTATATDGDLPAQTLTFSLGAGAPDGASITAEGAFSWTPTEVQGPGEYDIGVTVSDGEESDSETITVTVNEVALAVTPIAGMSRYDTAIEASKKAFPTGVTATVDGYKNVIVATGKNWPDALGGASLAGALECPILLTDPATLPATVAAEIERLGATRAVVLGGEGAVSAAVYGALDDLDGVSVMRIAGTSRYQTSYDIAEETVRVLEGKGAGFDGTAFIATGKNFPDALGASPIAAACGIPLYLVDPVAGLTPELQAALQADGVTDVIALGGTAVIPASVLSDVASAIGASTDRWAGSDRYDTAKVVATHGVDDYGLSWDKLAIATGANFPDALAGGALQGADGSVMLLTPSTSLYPGVAATLAANKATISEVRFLGGTGALSDAVRTAVAAALE